MLSGGAVRVLKAEREGFEPPVALVLQRISNPPHSSTLPPLQGLDLQCYEKYLDCVALSVSFLGLLLIGLLRVRDYFGTFVPISSVNFNKGLRADSSGVPSYLY